MDIWETKDFRTLPLQDNFSLFWPIESGTEISLPISDPPCITVSTAVLTV